MSKARKRHRQPWWKRAHTVRKWVRKMSRGPFVSLDAKLREVYPDTIEAPTYAGKYPWS